MFTVIWLVVFTVGLTVHILETHSVDKVSQTLLIAFVLFIIPSYTSSIAAVVWVSVTKRKHFFLEIIENISEVDNKIRCTLQEETYMNINAIFDIISELILLILLLQCTVIIYNVNHFANEPYYIIVIQIIKFGPDTCNASILYEFVYLVSIVKRKYSHLNKRPTN
jgi:hypothetical protein